MAGLLGVIFEMNNACSYASRVSQKNYLYFSTLPRPARSPDLSPIEHIWDHFRAELFLILAEGRAFVCICEEAKYLDVHPIVENSSCLEKDYCIWRHLVTKLKNGFC
ncbi:hypothetical protein TNCV_549371 [Trichonephila clavipes]|nr:hypothetical protein TNCV_549371 [Trichonephila clavipes]